MKTRTFPHLILLIALALSLVGGAFTATPARAASIVVTSAADMLANDGVCTLPEAIANADNDAQIFSGAGECGAGAGVDYISFNDIYTITLDGGELRVTSEIVITGINAEFTIIQASTCDPITLPGGCTPADHRVFLNQGGTLSLNNLTIRYGKCDFPCIGNGGGIFNTGTMNIVNSIVTNNVAGASGGGIVNNGSLSIVNSIVINNNALEGGGLYTSGQTSVLDSTFMLNSSLGAGGAIYNNGDTLTVTNSSFANNSSSSTGGGIHHLGLGPLTVTNSTFASNDAIFGGGGINAPSGAATLKNTIVANSVSGGNCGGSVTANAYNFDTDGSCGNATQKTSAQINLGPLSKNGAFTYTMALLVGSHAINAGDDAVCAAAPVNNLDQRGVMRPQGAHCDVGSYEVEMGTLTLRSQSANDGWVLESTETSGKGGTLDSAATTFRLGDFTGDKQYRAILDFDTSALPDTAVITKVTLKIKQSGAPVGTNPFTILNALKVDIRKPRFGSSAALVKSDFQSSASQANIGAIPKTPVANWYAKIWTSGTFFSFVNKTGSTQFRLYFSKDDNNDNAADYMKFFSGNAPAGSRPQLIVEYYVP